MLHRRRLVAPLVVAVAMVASLVAPSFASALANLTLRDGGGGADGKVTYDFGESRAKKTVTLIFEASEALATPPTVLLTDARDGNEVFDGSASAVAEVVGEKNVKVSVTIEPESSASGSYTAAVLLTGKEIASARADLVLDFDRSPSQGIAWLFAIVALVIGVGLGGFLHWLSGAGSQLRLLLTRYELLATLFEGNKWTPPALENALAAARVWLAEGQVENAEAALKAIEEKSEATLTVMWALAALEAKIGEGSAKVEKMTGLAAGAEPRLLDALKREREWLQQARDGAYPDATAEKESRATQAAQIAEYDMFLTEYSDPAKRDGKWETALAKYREGDYAAAKAAWSTPAAAAGMAAAAAPAEDGALGKAAGAGRFSQAKWLLIRHAPAGIGLVVAFGIVLVGLQTVFDVKTMFLTDDARDFLTLLAWGFGSALAGLTTTDLASKVMPKLPGG